MLSMRFLKFAVVATFARLSLAQSTGSDILTGLLQALNASGLTTLATLGASLNSSTVGQEILSALTSGTDYAIFAPDDQAFSQLPSGFASDPDLVANTFAYHVVSGNFSASNSSSGSLEAQSYPNVTIGRTLLNNSQYVTLEGGKGQVLVWTKNDSRIQILNQPSNLTVTNTTHINGTGIIINVIPSVLTIPPSLSAVLSDSNLNQNASLDLLSTFLNSTQVPYNGSNQSLASVFEAQTGGFTFFAPDDSALQAVSSGLTSLASNTAALQIVLGNHIINGTSVYSPELVTNANYTSASGEPFHIVTNSSGTFVTSGNVTAKVTHSDILTKNSVVHAIDHVFVNTESNPSAASSAYNSATSTAAFTTTETGPIGTPTRTGPASSSTTSGNRSSAQVLLKRDTRVLVTSFTGVVGFMLVGVFLV